MTLKPLLAAAGLSVSLAVPTFAGDPVIPDVIISEIVDATLPGGLPKYVEVTNCGDVPVDMSTISIGNYSNGGTALGGGTAALLSGMLAAGDSYVVADPREHGSGGAQLLRGDRARQLLPAGRYVPGHRHR